MAGYGNQKQRILFLREYFLKKTDEEHPVTMATLLELLEAKGYPVERKTVYEDIYALRDSGVDIIGMRGKRPCYFVASREFELPELKLLVDSVQSSKFITKKKTSALIKKIESLCSEEQARQLDRRVLVRNRVKSMNESVYYSVDAISSAISADSSIQFKYYDYTIRKERVFRHKGEPYTVSPFSLVWDNENYYLIAYSHKDGEFRNYRVDKMADIQLARQQRQGKELFSNLDITSYTDKTFGMFNGETCQVRIRFERSLAGAAIDRFGSEVVMVAEDEDHFILSTEVRLSPLFYAWIFEFGTKAELLSPEFAREEMRTMLRSVAGRYETSGPAGSHA